MGDINENISGRLYAANITFVVLATVSVILRLYVRVFISKSLGYDDGMIVPTLLVFLTYCTCSTIGLHYGTGRHKDALTPQHYEKAMEMWYFAELLYGVSSTMVRLSISFLLLRVTTARLHKYLIYACLATSSTVGLLLMGLLVFQCQPVSFYWSWERNPLDGHCIDPHVTSAVVYVHAITACINDWALGILPWTLVKGLNMTLQAKISAGLLLCCANFACIAGLVRLSAVKQLASYDDFLYRTLDVALWSTVEVGVGISACSLVTTRPLFKLLPVPERFRAFLGKDTIDTKGSGPRRAPVGSDSSTSPLKVTKTNTSYEPHSRLASVEEGIQVEKGLLDT